MHPEHYDPVQFGLINLHQSAKSLWIVFLIPAKKNQVPLCLSNWKKQGKMFVHLKATNPRARLFQPFCTMYVPLQEWIHELKSVWPFSKVQMGAKFFLNFSCSLKRKTDKFSGPVTAVQLSDSSDSPPDQPCGVIPLYFSVDWACSFRSCNFIFIQTQNRSRIKLFSLINRYTRHNWLV